MNDDYKVGYRKPPRHTQFKPETSGNHRGRPRRLKSFYALLEQQLDQLVPVTRNGRKVRIRAREIIMMNAVKSAAKGDARARDLLFRLMRESDNPDSFGFKPYDDEILAELAGTLLPIDDDDKSEA
ncbi:DUF5681 domain-containing protein [Methylobacterium sp. GC_Met_2]|uniref:DUF5681 domain-containing protein n=1 Tax=Methylobacterium sp. GC_Met_2 TaxID=2937376 RepID=UPI00226B1D26|nr:DUF5681 domain-containing protein [Methylobacterium sp. GC_Met_2]